MEASAVHAPALARRPLSTPLLRLRSDEQLVALFRAGSEDAFTAMHDRYRQRLFAYVRQMLSAGSRADAEDVLQDVFVRAYGSLRGDDRELNLRAWLYRVAHNRCIDHLRRPAPPAAEVFEVSRTPLLDPMETAQRRDDLKRLVEDVGRLPDQQRSALLMREIDGLAYADIADALDVTVPAVKSLLVRARVGLVEAIEARDMDCAVIRDDLASAYDRGVKASGRARKHMRECAGCRDYRTALRGVRRSFAALTPAGGLGPLALAAKALGIGGASAGGGSAAVGGGAAIGGSVAACKVAAVVCTAVVATGGGIAEVHHLATRHAAPHPTAKASAAPSAAVAAVAPAAAAVSERTLLRRTDTVAATPAAPRPAADEKAISDDGAGVEDAVATPPAATSPDDDAPGTVVGAGSGGTAAPAATDDAGAPTATPGPVATATPQASATPAPTSTPAAGPVATPVPTTTGPSPQH